MNRFRHTLLAFGIVLLILGVIGWVYYKKTYPYGHTHRCSKNLAFMLTGYAESHSGKFPAHENPEALGLSALLDDHPYALDMIVGKAGDLDEAREFYEKHGYILPEHSSWHYVEGLTTKDWEALAWDKIPLNHNGRKESYNPREVITTGGSVRVIKEKDWATYMAEEEKRASKRSSEPLDSSKMEQ